MQGIAVATMLYAAASTAAASRAPENDIEHNARREEEFVAYNPRYKELKAQRVADLKALAAKVEEREAARQSTSCSHQILWELKLLTGLTADFAAIDRRILDLRSTLDHPEREASADRQDSSDGSWGACYEAWHLKLMASYDRRNEGSAVPFRFLDGVNSPEKLTAYLTSIATSDIARTGIDRMFEFNESLSDLMRLILRDQPKGYPWDPRLKQTLMDLLLHRFRNPETGWWGLRYVRDGRSKFVDDLSITFHVVSYLDGKVSDLSRVIDTALALKDVDFPSGWLYQGTYWNHNNMDVAVLFRHGWSQATEDQRQAMRTELERMLRWCLAESLQSDGSFKPILPDASLEEANYFGATFLARSGYFDRARRFWTGRDFPEAEAIRRRILGYVNGHIKTGGVGGSYYNGILEELR